MVSVVSVYGETREQDRCSATQSADHGLRRTDGRVLRVQRADPTPRLLGWLLVCRPERQSSEELASALDASSGGISTNARMLIQFGYIERVGVAGDRRTYIIGCAPMHSRRGNANGSEPRPT